jgi:PAS domain S-box-containing protein
MSTSANTDSNGNGFRLCFRLQHGLALSHDATILDINNVAVKRYGYSRQEFLAMTILDIRPTTDVPKLLYRLPLDPRRQASITAEKSRHQDKNGTVFPVVITVWNTTFHGRQAELVLARPEGDKVGVN